MKRWLSNIAAGVSAMLCLASLILLAHSFFAVDEVIYPPAYRAEPSYELWIVVWRGHVSLNLSRYDHYLSANLPLASEPRRLRFQSNPRGSKRQAIYEGFLNDREMAWHLGFAAHQERGASQSKAYPGPNELDEWLVAFPLWFVALLTAIIPTLRYGRRRNQQRRTNLGLCPHCGYDLRATPERCPECGTIPVANKGAVT